MKDCLRKLLLNSCLKECDTTKLREHFESVDAGKPIVHVERRRTAFALFTLSVQDRIMTAHPNLPADSYTSCYRNEF